MTIRQIMAVSAAAAAALALTACSPKAEEHTEAPADSTMAAGTAAESAATVDSANADSPRFARPHKVSKTQVPVATLTRKVEPQALGADRAARATIRRNQPWHAEHTLGVVTVVQHNDVVAV